MFQFSTIAAQVVTEMVVGLLTFRSWGVRVVAKILYRPAVEDEHHRIVQVAKRSPYTKDFSNTIMFSSSRAYASGCIWVAVTRSGAVVGFACIRDKTRAPEVSLYFVGVDEPYQRKGIAWELMQRVMKTCRNKIMVLKCDKENAGALALYRKRGFVQYKEDEKYLHMHRTF